MHRLRGIASDVREENTPDGVIFSARLPVAEAGRYARYSLDSTVLDDDATAAAGDEDQDAREP